MHRGAKGFREVCRKRVAAHFQGGPALKEDTQPAAMSRGMNHKADDE